MESYVNTSFDPTRYVLECALADLQGSLEAYEQDDIHVHDWRAHKASIEEIKEFLEGMETQ